MCREAKTEADVRAWQDAEAVALRLVQDAFYEDTSDINSLPGCRAADIPWLRSLCAATPEPKP